MEKVFRFRGGGRRPSHQSSEDDDAALLRIGRRPAIRRKYGKWTMFALGIIEINQWSGVLLYEADPIQPPTVVVSEADQETSSTFQIGFVNGGSAGLVYGFLIAWLGSLATFIALAEMASMVPVSAGQYYWSAMVWPRSCAKLLSYVTGWMTVLGWQAGVASSAFAGALLTQTFIEVVDPNYVPQLWHTTLLYYGPLLLGFLVNIFSGRPLTWIQTGTLVIYATGWLAVMVPIVVLSSHTDASAVFTSFHNGGNWPTQGLSFMIGLSGVAFDFLGADGVYHLSEEVHNARIVVPWAIVVALGGGGLIGFLTVIALLFCITDPAEVLGSDYSYPFATVFLSATGSRAGSGVMTFVIVLMQTSATSALMASASRMLWAFARDKGVPASNVFSKVPDKSSIPRNAIIVTMVVPTLVGLINLGSPLAFNDLLSLSISALGGSYLVACLGLLYRRIRGDIQPFDSVESDELVNIPMSEEKLAWGPWHVPGIWGILINAVGCVYLVIVFFFSFWPTAQPVTASGMNYSVLLFGVVALISSVYYLVWGKKTFQGPSVDTTMFVQSNETKH